MVMEILVVLAHPDPESFNHALADCVLQTLKHQGWRANFHDLYAEKFNPILPAAEIPSEAPVDPQVAVYIEELRAADGLIFIHPNWWGQPPAILKGWIDRTFRPGVAYRFLPGDSGEGIPMGLLKAKGALILNTSNTPAAREHQVFGDPLDTLWNKCILSLCGVSQIKRKMFGTVADSSLEQRETWINETRILTEEFASNLARA
jgi:NAD(P)H dehydrogenase (quinone)